MSGEYNMFKCMTSCLTNDPTPSSGDLGKIYPFIFKRWLSNHPTGIIIANMFNIYSDVPIENQFKFVKNILRGKVKYIKYPKKNDDEIEYIINIIQKHYKIGFTVAEQYYNILPKEEIEKLVAMYTAHGRTQS